MSPDPTRDRLALGLTNGLARPVLFLDVDGVLNAHRQHPNGYCGTDPGCVAILNLVLDVVDPLVVVSSAWRYPVLTGAMTVHGLEILLLTHGLDCRNRVAAVLRHDAAADDCDRGQQISDWLAANRPAGWDRPYAAVDDLDLGVTALGHPLVRTDGAVGLTDAEADRLAALLLGVRHPHPLRPEDPTDG